MTEAGTRKPDKRSLITEAAVEVFAEKGFRQARVSDIAKKAGVADGTIYLYFKNKEDLFAAIIQRKKSLVFEKLREIVAADKPVAETLYEFGVTFAVHILSDDAIRGQRIVIGVIERMPELADSFFKFGPNTGPVLLANYLKRQVELGRLKPIDDPMFTSRQLGDLCMAGLYRPRLFGEMQEPPPREKIERNVEWAVRLFLNTYGVDKA